MQDAAGSAEGGSGLAEELPLGLPDDLEAGSALLEAEDRRAVTEELRDLSHAPDAAVRARAALALGRIGLPSGAARLLELAGDPAPEVRALATFGLGRVDTVLSGGGAEALRQRVVERLIPLLDDPAPVVAAQAAWALGVQARPEDAAARAGLAGVLAPGAGAPAEVVAGALGAWARLPGSDPGAAAPWLGAAEPQLRLAAARAVESSGDPNAVVALVPLLDDADARVRAAAARGLHGLPWSVARPRALGMLEDRDWRVVAAGLAWIRAAWRRRLPGDEVAEEALAAVLRATLQRDPHARVGGLAALGEVAADWPVALDRLLEAVSDEDPAVRLAALEALAAAGPAVAGPALERARRYHELDAPPPGDPAAVATAAARFRERPLETAALVRLLGGADDAAARGWLLLLAEHGPPPARIGALEAWAEQDPARAAAAARAFLQGGSPVLRAAAARQIARLHGRGRLPAAGSPVDRAPEAGGLRPWFDLLWEVQRALVGPGQEELRLVVLDVLNDLDPALLQLRASALFDEPAPAIRRWGLDLVRDETTPEILQQVTAAADTGRTAQDYRALARRVLQLQAEPPRVGVAAERGDFVVELRPDRAPLATVRLLDRAGAGALEEMVIHLLDDFVAHTGDPTATGLGLVGEAGPAEVAPGGFGEGSLGQVRTAPGLVGSRVFLTPAARPHLDGLHPLLGTVVEGQRAAARLQRGDRVSLRIASGAGGPLPRPRDPSPW